MKVEIPIIVQQAKVDTESFDQPKSTVKVFQVQPLFVEAVREQDRDLQRAIEKLVRELQKRLSRLARRGRHQEVARQIFSPDVELRKQTLRLELRHSKPRIHLPIATFQQDGRQIGFSPYFCDLWFEIPEGANLADTAASVFSDYFRLIEKNDGIAFAQAVVKRFETIGKIRLEYAEFNVDMNQVIETDRGMMCAIGDMAETVEGRTELEQVGRCLDHAYPNQLKRYMCDPAPLEALIHAIEAPQRRPILIVGRPLVGKSSLIHEMIFRRVAERRASYSPKENVWLLSPQRLISGMKYVGQWENRLLAILKHARNRSHILFFDDLLGLLQAGKTCSSDLAVADVLKPFLERGDVQVVAEITPESLRVLREHDRGFADLFDLIYIEEPDDERLVPVLLDAVRRLEREHECQFDLDVLPTILELTRRYQSDVAFPGKAVVLLEQLATKHPRREIDRKATLVEFRGISGLDLVFLDREQPLKRDDVLAFLRTQILGQSAAVNALADVVMVAKSGLNDPHKPLASLFFLGPTGVGKTECAKALARFLFGSEDRLQRFDMNEFVSAEAVARLVGTFGQPEGLLTSSVRQRPFGILLLDEIEKAHPDVFDLLLQVLGEARLSDALGRTVNFANMVIVLTSNLGTRDAEHEVGFSSDTKSQEAVYQRAVQQYFRPEFVNRLDQVVPFDALKREQLRTIAERTLEKVLAREGFSRRRCALDVCGVALDAVVEHGHHPRLGARAMKRAVEDHIVLPIGGKLAEIPTDRPTLITLSHRHHTLTTEVIGFQEADCIAEEIPPSRLDDLDGMIDRVIAVLDRVGRECERHRPSGAFGLENIETNSLRYFEMMEQIRGIRGQAKELQQQLEQKISGANLPAFMSFRFVRKGRHVRRGDWTRDPLREVTACMDIHEYLNDLCEDAARLANSAPSDTRVAELCRAVALLDLLRPLEDGWPAQRALVVIRSMAGSADIRRHLVNYLRMRSQLRIVASDANCVDFGFDQEHWAGDFDDDSSQRHWWELLPDGPLKNDCRRQMHFDVITVEGYKAADILSLAEGSYLFYDELGRLKPARVAVMPVPDGQTSADIFTTRLTALRDHGVRPEETEGQKDRDPLAWGDVVAIFSKRPDAYEYQWITDFRSGLQATMFEGKTQDVPLWASLPLPDELRD